MYVRKRKKKAITLLEIMIVIFLIGLIGSVIGYNVKGSLEEGKAFRSEQGSERIRDLLLMEVANGADLADVTSNPKEYLERSGLSNNVEKLLKDGWGRPYEIKPRGLQDISVRSESLALYRTKKNKKLPKEAQSKDLEQDAAAEGD